MALALALAALVLILYNAGAGLILLTGKSNEMHPRHRSLGAQNKSSRKKHWGEFGHEARQPLQHSNSRTARKRRVGLLYLRSTLNFLFDSSLLGCCALRATQFLTLCLAAASERKVCCQRLMAPGLSRLFPAL